MAVDGDYDERREDISPNKDNMSGRATAWEVLPRVEHDVAYSSEKAQNLEMLSIQVEDVASDYLALSMENEEELSAETVEKAFEFYILSGLLNSEVKELDDFVGSLQVDIMDVGQQLSENVQSEDLSSKIEEKLQGFEKSLKKTQDIVADIRMRSVKFESDLAFAGFGTCTGADIEMDISAHSSVNTDWKEQKDEQRHFLQMLEKSLARELDLEKKLSESTHNEDELKLKLHYAEQTIYNLEESIEMILQRTFEAENAAEILLGISRELSGKVQIVQLSLKGSIFEEGKLRSKLEESAKKSHAEELQESDLKANLQKAEDENELTNFEALSLRDKVRKLEEQLEESNTQLQIAKGSAESSCERRNNLNAEINDMENTIKCLKEDVLRLESQAESAEEKCAQVTKINHELDEQLKLLRSSESENANVLERKLKESDTRLEHAKASVEAIEEQQSMLYSALSDMGNLIDDLKGKVSKAESRAESAESKCNLLTETNLELNEELRFLRNRLECMEASLNQAEDARLAAAKDIGIRTKFISDLVIKLAMERERLQLQISALTKQNKLLTRRNSRTKDSASNKSQKETAGNKFGIHTTPEETLTGSVITHIKVGNSAAAASSSETCMETTLSSDEGQLEPVRTIEATQLNFKYLFMAILILLVSIFAIYLFQLE